ncbi:MAG TPA: CARDB domain-containing protein, partial [Nitrososphaera sp.]|nr:CARDB domain-containing protein [Nitrososphaera sp.]
MQTHNASKNGLRLALIAFVTLGIAASTTVSTMQYASAASMANLWAVPVNSRVDDGNFQILRLKFELDTGNPLEKIRVTVDAGTPDEKVLEFNANGDVLTADPAFVSVDGSIKIKTDGYVLTKLSGKFKIAMDKEALGVGEHEALAEIITTGETTTDDAHFRLRAGSSGQADLVANFFSAPDNVKQDKKYSAFVKEANEGTGNAGEHMISVYLSEDNTLDAGDLLVGEKEVENLKAGKDRMVHVQVELPDDAETGPAFLIVKVDGDDDI